MVEYNKSNEELKSIKNDLNSTKNKLDKDGNDINEKAKYIDELIKNQENFDHQYAKVIKLENELNKKILKDIENLKNNIEYLEYDKLRVVNEGNRVNREFYDKIH